MQIDKIYKSRTGATRKPLFLSSCRRFVFVECNYINKVTMRKWFWVNHRLFNLSDKTQ